MEQLLEAFILPINIIMQKDSLVKILYYFIYKWQSLVSTCDVFCVGNGIFLYFNEDGKLDLHDLLKKVTFYKNKFIVSFHWIHWNESENTICKCLVYFDFIG